MLTISQIARLLAVESFPILTRRILANGRWNCGLSDHLISASYGSGGGAIGYGLALIRGAELAYMPSMAMHDWATGLIENLDQAGGTRHLDTVPLVMATAGLAEWAKIIARPSDSMADDQPQNRTVTSMGLCPAPPYATISTASQVDAGLDELAARQTPSGLIRPHGGVAHNTAIDSRRTAHRTSTAAPATPADTTHAVVASFAVVTQLRDVAGAWERVDLESLTQAIEREGASEFAMNARPPSSTAAVGNDAQQVDTHKDQMKARMYEHAA